MSKFKITFLFIFLSVLFACGGGSSTEQQPPTQPPTQPPPEPVPVISFADLVLPDVIANRFSFNDSIKLAATQSGIYKQEDSQWVLKSENTWNVLDITIVFDDHYLASVKLNNEYFLLESVDSGESWTFLTTDFGGSGTANEKINRLKYEESTGILYATGYSALASSNDLGRTWTLLSGTWQGIAKGLHALAINEALNTVWFGGQGSIENPILRQYSLSNATTSNHDDITHLLPLPSTIESIVFQPSNSNIVYAAGEGGIIVSNDAGDSWEGLLLYNNYRFYYGLLVNPDDNNTIYTAGWSKDINTPQNLIVERSLDGGTTWEEFIHPSATLYGGVRSMAYSRNQDEELTLHLGLSEGGLIDVKFAD